MNQPTQHTESSRKREPPTTEAEALSRLSPALAAIVAEFRTRELSFNAWIASEKRGVDQWVHISTLVNPKEAR